MSPLILSTHLYVSAVLTPLSPFLDPNQAASEGSEVMAQPQEGSGDAAVAHDDHRVRILFERCLIACALYEEFWTRVRQKVVCA